MSSINKPNDKQLNELKLRISDLEVEIKNLETQLILSKAQNEVLIHELNNSRQLYITLQEVVRMRENNYE